MNQRRLATARRRAAKGAAYLDRVFRGKRWARDIKLKYLDIAEPCCCVRGQLEDAGRELGAGSLYVDGKNLGYYPREFAMDGESPEQTVAWAEEIRSRR